TPAGLRDKKRLQVAEDISWVDTYNNQYTTTAKANLDALYTYNNEGRILSVSYPGYGDYDGNGAPAISGGSYNYGVDTMGRLSGMTDQANHAVVDNVSYGPANELLTMNYNQGAYRESRTYNSLLQLTNITVGNGFGSTLMNLSYNYTAGVNN